METKLEMTLIKTRKYSLVPFGRFTIVWRCSKERAKKPNVLPFDEVRFNSESGMPYTPEQEKAFEKFMIKNHTDVLTDGRDFYTRMGDNWLEIRHAKLDSYKEFFKLRFLEDNKETWDKYIK
jgi:hypothetical protein